MAKKSIGDLHATITADAVQFVNEFKRADNEARRSTASIKKSLSQQFGDELGKTGKRFALGFLGAAAIGSVIGELQSVRQNIDSIPGVPTSTIESIRTMNYEFAKAKTVIDQAAARVLGFASDAATGVGAVIGAISVGGSMKDAADAIKGINEQAQAFARAGFNKELGALNSELERLKKGFKDEGVSDLDREADALAELASTGVLNLQKYRNAKLEALNAQFIAQGGVTQADQDAAALQAIRNRITVQGKLNSELKEYDTVLRAGIDVRAQDELSIKSTSGQLAALNEQLRIQFQLMREAQSIADGPSKTKRITEITKEINDIEHRIFTVTRSVKTAGEEMRSAFASSFDSLGNEIADFAIDGEFQLSNFTDVIAKNIISTFAKLAIINPLLNSMFGGSTGWVNLAQFGKPAADGGFRDGTKPYLVGEEGPEIFNPGGPGTIIPNHKISSMGSGGGSTTVINADLRGASVEAVMRLEQYVRSIDGTLEKRAIGAVANERKRGGGMGRGLGS